MQFIRLAAASLPLLSAWPRLRCGSTCHRATGRHSHGWNNALYQFGDQANENLGRYYATHRYSVIPDRDSGVHAVYDQVIRWAFHRGTLRAGGLQAVCGQAVLPANQLTAAKLCQGCAAALAPTDKPRPAPGSPLLREMAALYPGGAR